MGGQSSIRNALPSGVCLFALAAAAIYAAPVDAQQQPASDVVRIPTQDASGPQSAPAPGEGDRVIITGSRIAETGFDTPTPVTVASSADLLAATPNNLADGLNALPVFAGSVKTQNPTTTNQPGAYSGQNLLSLRGLGAGRTLLLLNGSRLPATNSAGAVDVNILPQGLVERVEVVTGGASAAYGSDAVSGVINFILDTDFEGLKFDIQGGRSGHDDLDAFGATLTWGGNAFDGRGRLIASADYFNQDGLAANEVTGRGWFDKTNGRVPNPVVGAQPAVIFITDARSSVGTYGGLITGCPAPTTAAACNLIRNQHFLPGGQLVAFNPGTNRGAAFQSGGDGARANIGLQPKQLRQSLFTRGEFDFTDALTGYAELLYSNTHTLQGAFYNNSSGAANQYTIFSGNPYLPASVQAVMTANNIASFNLGRFEQDLPIVVNESQVNVYHGAFGFQGDINDDWSWDASYTYGLARQWLSENGLTINRNLYAAADAVRAPNGQIVCRSTLLFGVDPGCVPRNVLGVQPFNDAVTNYVTGVSYQLEKITQRVTALNVQGNLGETFHLGAGPISVAAGLEYRSESANQVVDPISATTPNFNNVRGGPAALNGRLGGYRTNNPQAMAGSYNIKEGYVELGVPLLADLPLIQGLDLNLAARHADYSTGADKVWTWKAGLNYELNDELRFRLTRSQDIRGANVIELFNSSTQINNNTIYRGVSTPTQNFMSGNVNLLPETAQTLTYGLVYRPKTENPFQLSIDYYDITIEDAIGTVGAQREIDLCDQGFTAFCSLITLTPSNTLIVRVPTLNLSLVKRTGVDLEAIYGQDLWGGDLSLRLLLTNTLKDYSQAINSPTQPGLDSPGNPRWRGSFTVRYEKDNWAAFVQHRWQNESRLDPTRVTGIDLFPNHVPHVGYTDLTLKYMFDFRDKDQEVFFTITNLFDKEPPLSPPGVSAFTTAANPAYDPVGRYFTVGARTNF